MIWIDLITVLALAQFIFFGILVGKARATYKVPAPASTGHDMFDRYNRVHMNTLELLVVFIPALWMAAKYWQPAWIAAIGAVYLIGRMVYLSGYVKDPKKRGLGYMISSMPVVVLLIATCIGVARGYSAS